MPETIEITDVFIRIIGGFYAFAGFVAMRAAMTSHFLDRAIAAISGGKPSRIETAQAAWLMSAAALIFAGAVLLLAGLDLAAWVFLASALGQAAYIFFVAPRFFDREDPPDPQGRRQTTNAFVIFAAATAFVLWASYRGRLTALDQATPFELAAVGASLLLYGGYVARALLWKPSAPAFGGWGSTDEPDTPSRPLHTSTRLKLMADCGCDPLWALDDGYYGSFPPELLDLTADLTHAINTWAANYETSISMDDPATDLWNEAQHSAHEAEGRNLAARLKQQLPERTIYLHTRDAGAVEVHADGSLDQKGGG